MKKDNQTYFQDILKAVEKIEKYMKDQDFDAFQQDDMRQNAIIRQFEIIAEAANKLSKEFLDNNPEFPIKEAVSMRNFLIHGYDEVDLQVVWKTLQTDISFQHIQPVWTYEF